MVIEDVDEAREEDCSEGGRVNEGMVGGGEGRSLSGSVGRLNLLFTSSSCFVNT